MRLKTWVPVLFFLVVGVPKGLTAQAERGPGEASVRIENESWRLVGDLQRPESAAPVPVVLLLNQAAGDRTRYVGLARRLAARGIASLRLDLRGHGESTNLGRFEPGAVQRDPLIWNAESDIVAAYRYLRGLDGIDPARIGIVGASYSGEEAAEAGRRIGPVPLYVMLSPGSLSAASVAWMESSGVPWLFIASRGDPFLRDITELVRTTAPSAEIIIVPGAGHGTDLLQEHEPLTERIAEWIGQHLGPAA